MDAQKSKLKSIIPVAITAILALLKPAGLALVFAIPYLLIEKGLKGQSGRDIGFRVKGFGGDLWRRRWLAAAPAASGMLAVLLSKAFLPAFYAHVLTRVSPMLSFDKIPLLIAQLLVFALGEEIAFRAFLQSKLGQMVAPVWAVAITSLVFAAGHFTAGPPFVVLYDLLFIFIDSMIYGVLYLKTRNTFVCAVSHFVANLLGIALLLVV